MNFACNFGPREQIPMRFRTLRSCDAHPQTLFPTSVFHALSQALFTTSVFRALHQALKKNSFPHTFLCIFSNICFRHSSPGTFSKIVFFRNSLGTSFVAKSDEAKSVRWDVGVWRGRVSAVPGGQWVFWGGWGRVGWAICLILKGCFCRFCLELILNTV